MTVQFRKILVTSDLSDESTKAYIMARGMADKFGSTVTLLSVVDTSIQFGYGGIFEMPMVYVPEALSEILQRVGSELEAHVAEHFAGTEVTSVVKESTGPVHHTIASFIDDGDFDLVIMATHGRSGLRRMMIGSVAEQVLRASSAPVLLVPVRESQAPG